MLLSFLSWQATVAVISLAVLSAAASTNAYGGYSSQQAVAAAPMQHATNQNYYNYHRYSAPEYHQQPQQQYYQQDSEVEDERPRIRLNFGVHVPAMRIQLPRFQLPKITIRAKIRQPEAPPTISLPELNFDTTSKVSPPGGGGGVAIMSGGGSKSSPPGGYSYADSNANHQTFSASAEQGDNENSFTLSTQGGASPPNSGYNEYGNTYATSYTSKPALLPPSFHAQKYNSAGYQTPAASARGRQYQQHQNAYGGGSVANQLGNYQMTRNHLPARQMLHGYGSHSSSSQLTSYDDNNEGW